jgi:hypothetical protein
MSTIELFRILQRHAILERRMRGRGGIRVTEERELHGLRETIEANSGAARELMAAALRAGRSIEDVSVDDLRV